MSTITTGFAHQINKGCASIDKLRKATRTKSAFVSDDALMKILYLATMNIIEKWTAPIKKMGHDF